VQLNPSFMPGKWIDELVAEGLRHPESARLPSREGQEFGRRTAPTASSSRGRRACGRYWSFVRPDHGDGIGQEWPTSFRSSTTPCAVPSVAVSRRSSSTP
jgi:hypothetical protein